MFFRRFFKLMIKRKTEGYNELLELLKTLDDLLGAEIKNKISIQREELNQKYKDEEIDMNNDFFQEIYAFDLNELDNSKERFKRWNNLIWCSFYLSVYVEFEDEFTRLCEATKNMMDLNLSVNELRDKGISRAKSYLEKVAGFDLHITQKDWDEFKIFNEIRNCLAHSGGLVRKDNTKEYIKKTDGISLNHVNKIIIEKYFVDNFISKCQELYKNICSVLDDYAVNHLPEQSIEKYIN